MSLTDFAADVRRYGEVRRARDLRLGAVLLGAAAVALATLVALLYAPAAARPPRAVAAAPLVGAGAALAGAAIYVLATTRAFHRQHAPACPACGRPVGGLGADFALARDVALARTLAEVLERRDGVIAPALRERLVDQATLRCRHCDAAIAAPAV